MALVFPQQPPRIYSQPIDEWAEACADAEIARMQLLTGFAELPLAAKREIAQALLSQPDLYTRELKFFRLKPILVFDTETTGLSKQDVVIQLGYVCILSDGTVVDEKEQVWHTDVPCNPMALKVHRIDKHLVATGNDPRLELLDFLQLAQRVKLAGGVLVAHNAQFDTRMLQQTAQRVGVAFDVGEVFCTATALKKVPLSARGVNCKNADVYSFLGGKPMNMHQALNDAKATAFIFRRGRELSWW
jgi:DNA polymerase III alpha subunit (gram-positive type)